MTKLQRVLEANQDILSQYRQDLEHLKEEKDAINSTFLRNKLHDVYGPVLGFSTNEIQAHIRAALAPPPLDEKNRYTLSELINSYTEPDSWIIPKLLFGSGLYMLAAEPKAGKSLLIYDMGYGFTVSGKFLGLPCRKGKVILYQCEEPKGTIVRRLQSRGFEDNELNFEEANENLVIYRSFSLAKDLEKLAEVIDDEKPNIVMFDSLRAITSDVETSENNAEFSKYLYALQRLLTLKEVCGIVIHHGNKSGGVSGSLSMIGAVDGLIFLRKDKDFPNGTVRRLTTTPRNGSHADLRIDRISGEGGRWNFTLIEDLSSDEETQLVQQKILRYLSKHPGKEFPKAGICDGTGLSPKDREVDIALSQLCDDMILVSKLDKETKTFIYKLPKESVWTTAFTSDSTTETQEELVANYLLDREGYQYNNVGEAFLSLEAKLANKLTEATTIEEVQELSKSVKEATWIKSWELLMPDEQQRLIRLRHSPEYVEEQNVTINGRSYIIKSLYYDFDASLYKYKLDDGTTLTASDIDTPLSITTEDAIEEEVDDWLASLN